MTFCVNHPHTGGQVTCGRCGNFICSECWTATPSGEKFCGQCGDPQGDDRWSTHIQVFGILMIVHAALLICMAMVGVFGAIFVPSIMQNMNGLQDPAANPLGESGMTAIFLATYLSMGAVHGIAAVLQLIAGIKVLKRRGRTLAIVAISAGLLTLPLCYCAPTSLAIFVYGLVVLLQAPVAAVFRRNTPSN